MRPETLGGRGLPFCAALSGFRRLSNLIDLVAKPASDRRCGGLAGLLYRLARALSAAVAPATGEAMLGKRGQSSGRRDRDQLSDKRTLQQLDECVAHIV